MEALAIAGFFIVGAVVALTVIVTIVIGIFNDIVKFIRKVRHG